jgi:alpha-L-rhamnosidase
MPNVETCGKYFSLCMTFVIAGALLIPAAAGAQPAKPEHLRCESLSTPLGMDAKEPLLSWVLEDPRMGARQSAYELQVASSTALLESGKPDIWDSGRVASDNSIGAKYQGPALQPSRRYFWRVLVWDSDAKPYPASDITWWETGLLDQENWKAKWISYEESELQRVRESGADWITNSKTEVPKGAKETKHDFRFSFSLAKPARLGTLYVTGEDTAAAWINGKQVLQSELLPPWRQFPWGTYKSLSVTSALQAGQNILAIEIIRYLSESNSGQTPMSAVLYVEDTDGHVELFKSSPQGWRTALNAAGNWQSPDFKDDSWKEAVRFISPADSDGLPGNPWPNGAVKALRRTFEITKPIASARIYATALGAYKLAINGQNVGDQILAPGWTDFRQHVVYQTYDVTANILPGRNTVAALLAPGWYATPLSWLQQGFNYGKTPPALRAQLRLEYKDGSVDWIQTDERWKADLSPISKAEIYDGETYDARRAQANWNTAAFDDSKWKPVEIVVPHQPRIEWQYFPPIRIEKILDAKAITNPSPGVYIFDFGQDLSGVARLRTQGPPGTDVRLRFAEVLNPDGSLYVDNLRTAKATDHFILAGNGTEEFQPSFTFHGFRYVEVSGVTAGPKLEDVKALAFHTDAPFTASLKTGSAMINQLWSNILWGQRSNFVGVPTDCPQRDERLGWTADAQVFWRAAAYNMDLTTFSRKFGGDLLGTQVGTPMYGIYAPGLWSPNPGYGTGWSDAGVIIPWTSWVQTGDKKILEENWEGMERYLASIEEKNPNHLWKKDYGIPFADWLSPEGITPVDLIATAYWAYDVTLMSQMAHALGNSADEQKYRALFAKIKTAFIQNYVRPDGFVGGVPPPPVFASGAEKPLSDKPVETQTGYVLALHMNLLPEALREAAAKRLVDRIEANHWRLGTGFLGTPYLLGVLTDTGHADVAYRLLLNTEYPSWGYLVEHGATTMWERWNGDQMRDDPSMNSYNHYAYGAVADWIYRYAAGIDTDPADPGFHTIRLHPNFDSRLGSLDFTYESAYGTIQSAWSISGKKAVWNIRIPANAKGHLEMRQEQLPSYSLDGEALSQSNKLRLLRKDAEVTVFEIPAGSYNFSVSLP